jgi:hypothetical protein
LGGSSLLREQSRNQQNEDGESASFHGISQRETEKFKTRRAV